MEDDGDEDKVVEDDMGVFRIVEDESEANCDDWNNESNDGRVKGCWEVLGEVVGVEDDVEEESGVEV
uniref:Candidate secreted effector n=1 Tax=Meloidogyne incognita TaxID=6306 RepID=A0A914L4P3_MELIC